MITKKIQLLFSILLLTAVTLAQVNVNVNIKRPIPTKVSAWEQDPSVIQVILQNTTQQSYEDAYVLVEVEDESGTIVGKTETGNPAIPTFTIPAGPPSGSGVLVLTGHDIVDMNAFDIDDAVQSSITTTNQLPEGYYEFCFTLLGANGNPIGMPETNCVTIEILHPEPPALISPVNEIVMAEYPQFIWAPVVGASPEQFIKYKITIAPRFEGQNIRTAVEANNPLVESFIQSTTYQYTPSDLPFETYSDAEDYVWQVQALDLDNEPVGTNQGKSEIAFFKFEEEVEDTLSGDIDVPGVIPDIPIITTLPTSKIKGQLRWAFKTEGSPSSSSSGGGSGLNYGGGTIINNPNSFGNVFDPNSGGDSDEGGSSLFGGGSSGNINFGNIDFGGINFSNIFTHPVKNTSVKVYARSSAYLSPTKLIGTAETDSDGNFEIEFVDLGSEGSPAISVQGQTVSFDKIKVTIDDPHLEFDENTYTFSSEGEGTYSIGTQYGLGKTFNFKPTVKNKDTGQEVTDAVIKVGRFDQFYNNNPSLTPEGGSSEDKEVLASLFSIDIVLIDSVFSGETLENLFQNESGAVVNNFYIEVTAPGHRSLTTFLSMNSNTSSEVIPTVEKTYELRASNPQVEGRVVREDNLAPMPNLTVSLSQNDDVKYSTTTDNDGNFSIGNIDVSDDPYLLKVEGQKISTYEEELTLNQKGRIIKRDPLEVSADLVTIAGKIVDKDGDGIPNANLRWSSGGNSFFTDTEGRFVTANLAGEDSLHIRKWVSLTKIL